MFKTDVRLELEYREADVIAAITRRLPVQADELSDVTVIKRTLCLDDKADIHYKATVAARISPEREAGLLKMKKRVAPYEGYSLELPAWRRSSRPVVVGAGPAGLFCALMLAEAGARPILFERGLSVDERKRRVDNFASLGVLDEECNVQFGEGGAGTYSDGKLKVGSMDKYKHRILSEFVDCGADKDIMFATGAHIGTDKLSEIVKRIRDRIRALSGEVIFGARLTDVLVRDGRVVGGRTVRDGVCSEFECDTLILATGHSARDTFEMLRRIGANLEPKGFGIGLRIEHPREYIDSLVYGKKRPLSLGAASYHLVTHLDSGRSVYSFCMCPGGTVVHAASERGGIVTNGMSENARDGENSNAALLVSATPADFGSDDPLAGIELQRRIERRAFAIAGGSYRAPSASLDSFMSGGEADIRAVRPTYPVGVEPISPDEYLPPFVTDSLRAAMPDFDAWMPGYFLGDAVLTGPETRTTSPVRVLRDADFHAFGIEGLYPIGEGAGYAGGIISSARDGVMCAEAILKNQ